MPHELVMRLQVERQEEPLQQQKAMLEEFKQAEADVLNKLVLADSFGSQVTEVPNWELAAFHVRGSSVDSAAEIRGDWQPALVTPTTHGLQLRNFIMRTKRVVYLKSIACEVKLSVRLVGDATLWVITRAAGVKDPDGMVCKVKKEQDTQRVFLTFGAHVGPHNEFKFFKRQELPELAEHNEEALAQDFVDLKMTLIDNGDDRVFVSAATSARRGLNMTCNKFIPNFRDCHLMLAGSGDSVLLNYVALRQIERIESTFRPAEYQECCSLL